MVLWQSLPWSLFYEAKYSGVENSLWEPIHSQTMKLKTPIDNIYSKVAIMPAYGCNSLANIKYTKHVK